MEGILGSTPISLNPNKLQAKVVPPMRKRKQDANTNSEQDEAAQASRNGAAADVPAPEESSGGGGMGKLLLLLLIAGVLALVLSKDVRSKVLDMLFGAEEEFDYSSTTMPVSEPPVGAPAS
jgi:hypothetical protein